MIPFEKCEGIGNDFVLVRRNEVEHLDLSAFSKSVCNRHTGVGADGLLVVDDPRSPSLQMFNPDGSESGMCGNGLRCAAIWYHERGAGDEFNILMSGNQYPTRVRHHQANILFPMPVAETQDCSLTNHSFSFGSNEFFGSTAWVGNPHLVIFVDELQGQHLAFGPELEVHSMFPHRTNVHFARIDSRTEATMLTWERGAGATLACGSGACAVAFVGWQLGRLDATVSIRLPGGTLHIRKISDQQLEMAGPARFVFTGEFSAT